MTATAKTEVVGAKEAIKALRKLDPELRKQFNRDVKEITLPIVQRGQAAYPDKMLSGMDRKWAQRGNPKFPYNASKARKGVKPKIDTKRDAVAVVKVVQTDPAATIVEFAGKKTSNRLATALDRFGRVSRFLWPAAEKELPAVTRQIERTVLDATRTVQKDI